VNSVVNNAAQSFRQAVFMSTSRARPVENGFRISESIQSLRLFPDPAMIRPFVPQRLGVQGRSKIVRRKIGQL